MLYFFVNNQYIYIITDGNVQHRHKAHLDGPLTSVQLFTVEAKHAHALMLNTSRDPLLNLEGNFFHNGIVLSLTKSSIFFILMFLSHLFIFLDEVHPEHPIIQRLVEKTGGSGVASVGSGKLKNKIKNICHLLSYRIMNMFF